MQKNRTTAKTRPSALHFWVIVLFLTFAIFLPLTPGYAGEDAPPADVSQTLQTLRLTPDETKVIQLESDAASIVVTNPNHASVALDSPRTLIVMPRQPGATTFKVLDSKGIPFYQAVVIVSSETKSNYMRIRRICNPNDRACVPDAHYYCPDGCYAVDPVTPTGPATIPPVISNSGSAAMPLENNNNTTTQPAEQNLIPEASPEVTPPPMLTEEPEGAATE